jgi:DnaK suppressor protein
MTKTSKNGVINNRAVERAVERKATAGAPKASATTAVARKAAKAKQAELQQQAWLLKSMMSTTAASVVAYQQTSGDYGDMSQQSEQEWLFLNRNKANAKELGLIERALRRIKDGSYGTCSRCTQPISPRRLQAVPWAECCVECQEENNGPVGLTA